MALMKTRVTGRLPLPNDDVWAGSYVQFQLRAVDTDKAGGAVLMSKPAIAELDENGDISIDLWPNGRGDRDTVYQVKAYLLSPVTLRQAETDLGIIVVPEVGPVDLVDLLQISAPVPNVPDALAQALAAAAVATGAAKSVEGVVIDAAAVKEDRNATEAFRNQAAAYAEAAGTGAQFYDTIALGRAAVADGGSFGVRAGGPDSLARATVFRRDSSVAQTVIVELAPGAEVDALVGQLSDVEFRSTAGVPFAITDSAGNSSDVELNMQGQFTDRVVGGLAPRIADYLPPASLDGIIAEDLPATSSISLVIADEGRDTSDLELDLQGHISSRVFSLWAARMRLLLGVADLWDKPPARLLPIGDSLTAGAGGSAGNRWREVLSELTGIPHDPMGVGGETARTITARTSALSMLATFPGNEILATTAPVDITLTYQDGAAVAPLVQGSLGINPVEICGVAGTLSRVAGPPVVYRFTRSAAGDAVAMPAPPRVKTFAYDAYRNGFPIIGIGQNGGYADLDDLIRMNWAMINWTSQGRAGRYLVWARTGVNAATNAEMESRYSKEFGPHFVNIRALLSSLWAFKVAGLTPTQDDLDAIAVGSVPPSFRIDAVHHNNAGQYVIAVAFYLAGKSLSYWS